jgi:hypothetical protein
MDHISQAWTNLAPPSAIFLTDSATESLGASSPVTFPVLHLIARNRAERSGSLIAF